MTARLTKLVKSTAFKQASFFSGIVFMVSTLFVVLDPTQFLRFGYLGVFVFNLFGPGTLLIPTLSQFMNVPLLATVTSLGMAFNDSVAWLVGKNSEVFIGKPERLARIQKTIEKYGLWALFFWSLVPIPYDFVGFVAGYLRIPYKKYLFPTFAGKFVRFVLMGYGVITAIDIFTS